MARPTDNAPVRSPWSVRARLIVSLLLLWHLTAVFLGPVSLPPSRTAEALEPIFGPYMSATYLRHGYKFFAPDPGPSHLVRYEIDLPDGTREEGVFPDLRTQQPRLFYHRHFMLSEAVNSAPPDPGWMPMPGMEWSQFPLSRVQNLFVRSYADHLLHDRNAKRVTLYLREHLIPSPEQVAGGMRLDDRSLYRERRLGTFTATP